MFSLYGVFVEVQADYDGTIGNEQQSQTLARLYCTPLAPIAAVESCQSRPRQHLRHKESRFYLLKLSQRQTLDLGHRHLFSFVRRKKHKNALGGFKLPALDWLPERINKASISLSLKEDAVDRGTWGKDQGGRGEASGGQSDG